MIREFIKPLFVPTIENKLPVIRGEAVKVRAMPAGARIHYQGDDGVKLSVPGYRRGIVKWGFLFAAILFFVLIPMLLFGTADSYRSSYSGRIINERNWFLTVSLVAAIPAFCIWAYRFLKPRIVITARDDRIHVASGNNEGIIFDAKNYGGMAEGHEMKSGKIKDQTGLGIFTGLKVIYGNWGEETPFMFQKGRGKEYLLWMNDLINPVIAGETVHESEIGERAQAF